MPAIATEELSGPLTIDGLLTEETWQKAAPVTTFLQKDPQEGSPATERTEVRALFDNHHIYFGIVCHDSEPHGIRATELRRDNSLNNDDIFEILLDTFHDHRNGYLFRINALGTQYDATITNEGQTVNESWDERWESSARLTEQGWSAEIRIPFKALRFASGESLTWGVNFHRTIKRKNEDVYWTAHNRSYRFEEVSRAGHLTGLSEIQGFSFRVKPYFLTGVSKSLAHGAYDTTHLTDVGIEDAKYMITPRMALDLTVNPDFAQAEVDRAQTNLTRFSLFFPEKREFFQEGAGLFQFGAGGADWEGRPEVALFHSRRIGLSDNREEIPIRAGLKLTGKEGPLEIGLLNMQTARSGAVPGQNFTVARVKGNLLARSYLGAIFTRNTAGADGFSSRAGGVDGSFTFLQHLNLRGFLARSDAPNTAQREWAAYAEGEWESDRFEFSYQYMSLQENFLPAMGFVARAEENWRGVKRNAAEASYNPRPAIEFVRQFEFSTSLDYISTQQDRLDTRSWELSWSTDFQSGDAVDIEWSREFERLVRPLRIRGGSTVPSGDYHSDEYRVMLRTFRGRSLSGNLQFQRGGFYHGTRTSLELSPQLKVSQNLSLDPEYQWTRIALPGHPAFTIQELNATANYAFSQKWLTRATVQLNSQDRQWAFNARLNYIFRPGDNLYLIYNEARTYGAAGQLQNRGLIVKVTYSFDY